MTSGGDVDYQGQLEAHLLVAYVTAAAEDLVEHHESAAGWALDEALTQLAAEHLRLREPDFSSNQTEVAALCRALGPRLELSDLVLRAMRDVAPETSKPESLAEERRTRLQNIEELISCLKSTAAGDSASAAFVRDVFAQASELLMREDADVAV
jgi:hypothetical protein